MKKTLIFDVEMPDFVHPMSGVAALEAHLKAYSGVGKLREIKPEYLVAAIYQALGAGHAGVGVHVCHCDTDVDKESGLSPGEVPYLRGTEPRPTTFWGEPVWAESCSVCKLRRLMAEYGLIDPPPVPEAVQTT